MINDLVKENERVDDLQNGYYIIQDPRKFCFVWTLFFYLGLPE